MLSSNFIPGEEPYWLVLDPIPCLSSSYRASGEEGHSKLLCLPRWNIKSKVCWTNTLATTVHSIHKTRQSISHNSPVEKTLLFSTIRNKYCHRVRWVFLVCNRTLRNRAKPDTPHPLHHHFLSVIHSLSYLTNIYEVDTISQALR